MWFLLRSKRAAPNRIQIRNVLYLLLYAWDMAAWRDRWRGAAEASPSLLGLLSRILVDSTRDLLRHQLGRAYQPRKQIIPGIRGRMDFGPSLKSRAFEEGKAHCTFAELGGTPHPSDRKSGFLRWIAAVEKCFVVSDRRRRACGKCAKPSRVLQVAVGICVVCRFPSAASFSTGPSRARKINFFGRPISQCLM